MVFENHDIIVRNDAVFRSRKRQKAKKKKKKKTKRNEMKNKRKKTILDNAV